MLWGGGRQLRPSWVPPDTPCEDLQYWEAAYSTGKQEGSGHPFLFLLPFPLLSWGSQLYAQQRRPFYWRERKRRTGTRRKGGVGRRRKRKEKEVPFEEGSLCWQVLCQLGIAIAILEEKASVKGMPPTRLACGKVCRAFFF